MVGEPRQAIGNGFQNSALLIPGMNQSL